MLLNKPYFISWFSCPETSIPEDKTFFTYEGSLTTPPLLESVIWTVFKEHVYFSEDQVTPFTFYQTLTSSNISLQTELYNCIETNTFDTTIPASHSLVAFQDDCVKVKMMRCLKIKCEDADSSDEEGSEMVDNYR